MTCRTATRLGGAALAVLAGLAALSACGGSGTGASGSADSPAGQAAEGNPNLDLGTSLGGDQAPDFRLTNQFGQPMSLSQFRGKVVILAFSDSQCTTVCPLTTQSMVQAKQLLGPAGADVQLLGIDANPQATTVADVRSYSQAHGMINQWDFLTGSQAQLKATWKAYHIDVQIEQGQIDHTPALYVIDQRGKEQKIYLTSMAYSSVVQSGQVVAQEVSSLLPGHPKLTSLQSLAAVPEQTPASSITMPAASGGAPIQLRPGKARLVFFFATWLSEVSDLSSELTSLNVYVRAATGDHLPPLTAVDETATEPSNQAVQACLRQAGGLSYPVAMDTAGRVADGYGVQDQPWFALVSASGKIVWSHDGWLPVSALEAAARRA